MYKPRVGDTAFIKDNSEYYGISESNPSNSPGIIETVPNMPTINGHYINVYWYEWALYNDYRFTDLWIIPKELC